MKTLKYITAVIAFLMLVSSCDINCDCGMELEPDHYDKVMIFYASGYNNLSYSIQDNLSTLLEGYIPGQFSGDALVVVSHFSNRATYDGSPAPVITRYYSDKKGQVQCDTLAVMPDGSMLTNAGNMRNALQIIDERFHAARYGMLFSSHATGWLPSGFYESPSRFGSQRSAPSLPDGAVPYVERELKDGEPMVKSIGQTRIGSIAYELELKDFVEAIPFHLDYILFDACLMGGIEVAYELREKCDRIGFSPTEILSQGFDYSRIGELLLQKADADPRTVCKEYFESYYNQEEEDYRSATITLVDCSRLDRLASICSILFEKYRDKIARLRATDVQRYYRSDKKWFFDLQDMLLKCGLEVAEAVELQAALDECIEYKAATESFLKKYGGFDIEHYSGFSTYLPYEGKATLDNAYCKLQWNIATGFLK